MYIPQRLVNSTNLINFLIYLGLQCIIFSNAAPNFPKQPSTARQFPCHGDINYGSRKTLFNNVKTLNSYPPAIRIILYMLLKTSECSVCELGFYFKYMFILRIITKILCILYSRCVCGALQLWCAYYRFRMKITVLSVRHKTITPSIRQS